ncbi:DUF2790 domain-containing protein [Azotobacter beijerinckii]|uniref:DUF2790 domain-containing protein n=1 Tax=Azotobacter beijerinckii TaxID=170623 RepID=A0A1I4GZ23_9GAMM|nr:DUF2790 domain-containing protein [Azotobacter beijerinckii]SFB62484.1 Protein of unknown function [Azotobacter beijerinckii]SFL35185.1 Protein of unknown function [Azotobacter beijerinckii]
MKRSAVLAIATIYFIAMGNAVSAAEVEPDPLAADTQLIASHEPTSDEKTAEVNDYTYSDKLDIRKVVAIESNSMACGLAPALMTYEDTHGEVHTVHYQIMGTGCQGGY